eukprot:JP446636.1.p1 GENE.JP446636.1~~JP446636.1.p1  ORF type:complete len:191 (-),score=9.38 JP446636.1:330-902(-)
MSMQFEDRRHSLMLSPRDKHCATYRPQLSSEQIRVMKKQEQRRNNPMKWPPPPPTEHFERTSISAHGLGNSRKIVYNERDNDITQKTPFGWIATSGDSALGRDQQGVVRPIKRLQNHADHSIRIKGTIYPHNTNPHAYAFPSPRYPSPGSMTSRQSPGRSAGSTMMMSPSASASTSTLPSLHLSGATTVR